MAINWNPEINRVIYSKKSDDKTISWKKCPFDTKYIDLSENWFSVFNWKESPKTLKEVNLGYNFISNFTWEGCPEGLEKISLSHNEYCIQFSWEGCPKSIKEEEELLL